MESKKLTLNAEIEQNNSSNGYKRKGDGGTISRKTREAMRKRKLTIKE